MVLQSFDVGHIVEVPDLDRAIQRTTEESVRLLAEGQARDGVAVTPERPQQLEGLRVPDVDEPAVVPGGQELSVGRDCERVDAGAVTLVLGLRSLATTGQFEELLARLEVPLNEPGVLRGGEEVLAVGGEDQAGDGELVVLVLQEADGLGIEIDVSVVLGDGFLELACLLQAVVLESLVDRVVERVVVRCAFPLCKKGKEIKIVSS